MTDFTHDGSDEGFHEIQLSGKQLVFLFMATTVVSVVIFLCGVLVGRGVRGDTVNAAEPQASAAQTAPTTGTEPTTIDPPAATSDATLTYSKRLDDPKPVTEVLKPVSEPKPQPPAPVAETKAEPPAAAATKAAADPPPAPAKPTPTTETQGRAGIWAVQVVALSDRNAASAVVQRLKSKGYQAFVLMPQPGVAVQHYKVQVGRFTDRSEAEQTKARLKKEEQFEPIIVR